MRARLRELFGRIDKNKNGVLDGEERDEMREEVRLILMELGIGANVFERLRAGANYEEIEAWFVREWETASKMQALAGIDIELLRAAAQSIPSGSPDFPLGGLAGWVRRTLPGSARRGLLLLPRKLSSRSRPRSGSRRRR